MTRFREVVGVCLAAALGGCTVGPNYHAPAPPKDVAFHVAPALDRHPTESASPQRSGALPVPGPAEGPAPHIGGEPLDAWWTVFHDPELESLIGRALKNNRDLKTAILRVRAAREERLVAAGGLLPTLDADAGYNRGRGSKNVVLPLGGMGGSGGSSGGSGSSSSKSATPRSGIHPDEVTGGGGSGSGAGAAGGAGGSAVPPGGPNTPFGEGGLPGVTTNLFQAGFDAVYEFDLFGGTRRAIEAADAQAAAALEGQRSVQISLCAEVARTYLEVRQAQTREAIAVRNLATQRESWKIAEDKFRSGLGNEAQAAAEGAQVHITEATLPSLFAAAQTARQSLAFILGESPNALDHELASSERLPPIPSDVPLGMPSDLVRRRPDIRQAERQLAAAYAEIGVATAQLFPQFSITGSFGFDSSTIKHLADWGSHYYSVAPGVHWSILNFTQLHAAIRIENALEEQALLAYENSVSQAFKEVQDALVQYAADRERHAALVQAVAESQRALRVARQTYAAGLADQVQSLDVERTLLQAEDALAQSDASLRLDLVALYKALGGGWEQNLTN